MLLLDLVDVLGELSLHGAHLLPKEIDSVLQVVSDITHRLSPIDWNAGA